MPDEQEVVATVPMPKPFRPKPLPPILECDRCHHAEREGLLHASNGQWLCIECFGKFATESELTRPK